MILIYPPITKPCEPPPGIARLAGALRASGVSCHLVDANVEGIHYLFEHQSPGDGTRLHRAVKNRDRNLRALQTWHAYSNEARYRQTLFEVNHLIERWGSGRGVRLSFVDYEDEQLSPQQSKDLLYAAGHPEENPFYDYFSTRLQKEVEQDESGVVGISLTFLSQALCAFAIIGFLKRVFPRIMVVIGGGLVTSWVKSPKWANPFRGLVDHVVAGPGEPFLLSLSGKREGDYDPWLPCYADLPLDRYLAPGRVLPFSTSFGCYWNHCSFCPERAEGNPYIQIPPEEVITQLRQLTTEIKPALIHLTDNALSPAMMRALAASPPGAPWYGFARITPHLADRSFCKALQGSGCVMLKLGLESGDQAVLDRLHKGMRLETASEALQTLKESGIGTYVYLLFGTPPETQASARRTLLFVEDHSGYIDFLNVAIFNPPLYCPEIGHLRRTEFYDGDLSFYSGFAHPAGWGRAQVRRFLEKEFRKNHDIANIVRRQPPFFTSNHAPFFLMSRQKKAYGASVS